MEPQQVILVAPSRLWRSRDFGHEPPIPGPFSVRLDPAISHVWAGVIHEPGHEFDGQSVYLSQRQKEWTGEINVEVAPAAQHGYFSGYGHIHSRPTKPFIDGKPLRPSPVKPRAPHERLIALWAGPEYAYNRVVTHGTAEVASLAAHYGVRLPDDFRDYLIHACSTFDDGGDMDGFGNAWWGLERIRSLIEECGEAEPSLALAPMKALLFADTLIWCTAWGICCGEGPDFGRIFLVSDRNRFVADSFTEFVTRYLEDDKALY